MLSTFAIILECVKNNFDCAKVHFEIILSLSFLKLPIFVFWRTAKILLKFFLHVILNSEFQLFCLEMDDSMLYVNISLVLFGFFFCFCFFEDDDEHDWILKTCRKGWDENVGYRPDLIK